MLKLNYRVGQLLIAMLLSITQVFAQDRTVTGTVSDENSDPVPGATVQIKGTSSGTITDASGKFSLSVGANDVLVISFIGYQTQEITVGSQSTINVSMVTDVTQLAEVVVTGYASQQKKDLTGSVGVVDAAELTQMPTGNVANQLQGRATGVTVTGSGQPGATSKVRIRGFGSFQNNDPLYIVDGVPTQDISTLNPSDIEGMAVLKDAGAASIYGSRASNGVIIITTKQGKDGVQVKFDMYYGSQNPGSGPKGLLDTQGYADAQWLVYDNDGTVEDHPIYGPSSNASPSLPSWAANTDWYDVMTDPASIQNYDISLSGGNASSKFFAGVGYFSQNGIIQQTYSDRLSVRFNSEFNISDRVTVGENITVSYRKGNGVTNLGEASPIQMGSYRTQPIIPAIVDQNITGISHNFVPGEYGGTGIAPRLGNGDNVLAQLTRNKDDWQSDVRLLGSMFLDVKIVEGLHFRSTIGGTMQNGYGINYNYATYESSENVATPSFTENAYYNHDWVWSNTVNYNGLFNEQHSVAVVAGYEAVKYGIGRNVSGQRAGYFSNDVDFRTLNNGATIVSANSSANTPTTLASLFGRVDYAYKDKYLVGVTVRRDGSSRFGADYRYGTFPSFSAGWRMSDEPFMSGVTWITDLKIRGGYGTMGNQLAVSPINQFDLYGGSAGTSNYDLNGTTNSSLQGWRPFQIGNPDAKWETNVTTDIGFDAGFADNKLELIFDWFKKDTEDLLYQIELPGTAGAATPPFVNVASMTNTGFEIQAIYRNQWGDFGFEGNLTWSTYKNEITGLAPGIPFFDAGTSRIGPFTRNQPGHSVSSFYGYQVVGLFQSDSEANAAGQDGAEAGFFQFQENDGTAGISPDDRTFIGDPNPDFTYGLNLALTYKAFDLTAFFYGTQGNDIFNWNLWWTDFWPSFQGQKSENLLNNSWTPSNTGATTPKASNKSNFSTNTQSTSYYIEDGSYLRLKNLEFGYNFNPATLGNSGFSSLRLYLQGVNLFTATQYSGLDPELGGADTDFGVDRGNYPTVKQYLVGLRASF